MPSDPLDRARVSRQPVQGAVVGIRINPPKPGATDIGEPRAVLAPQQAEQPDHHVAGTGRVGLRLQAGLLFHETGKDVDGIAQGSGDDDVANPGVLISGEVLVGDPTFGAEILPTGTRVDSIFHSDSIVFLSKRAAMLLFMSGVSTVRPPAQRKRESLHAIHPCNQQESE